MILLKKKTKIKPIKANKTDLLDLIYQNKINNFYN